MPTFHEIGIECQQAPAVQKSLTYEGPVSLATGNIFHGDCTLGAFTYVNGASTFANTAIGRYCSVAEGVITAPGQHSTEAFSTHPFVCDPHDNVTRLGFSPTYQKLVGRNTPTLPAGKRRVHATSTVTIGHDVWIGTRAIILNGVNIGHGAVIAAGAIVTKDVAPYTIVAGVPARTLRTRFAREVIDELLALSWWDYDMSQVSNRVDYGNVRGVIAFMNDLLVRKQLKKFEPERWRLEPDANGAAKITKLR